MNSDALLSYMPDGYLAMFIVHRHEAACFIRLKPGGWGNMIWYMEVHLEDVLGDIIVVEHAIDTAAKLGTKPVNILLGLASASRLTLRIGSRDSPRHSG